MTRRRSLTSSLSTPLARWGFTTLAIFGAATGQYTPALITGALATYAWNTRR
ncbi:hypothetical protein OHU11_29980 [Streptomyces sp. NBC_00257]|uniref:hypothetical protein n=1 Tax=unclassified Streptomyces TaxID=2593676 RepID=UPI002257B9F6|nr:MULTISPECIES: hypothetical protein [unclassified Streptomyces]MCX5431881.1 hypothetical protein [Streptomyces sp. NBC_00062]